MNEAELRALLDACKGTGNLAHVPSGTGGGGLVRFSGRVVLTGSDPLPIYPGATLEGDGPSSLIDATGFAGPHAIEFRENAIDPSIRCEKGGVSRLRVELRAGSGQAAIGVSPSKSPSGAACFAHECAVRDVEVMGDFGVVAPNFQESTIDGLFSLGAVEMIADLGGHELALRRIRHDGAMIGQSTAPYIRVAGSSGARLENIVIEGLGRSGKPGVLLDGCSGVVIDGLRVTPEASGDLDMLQLVGCKGITVRGEIRTLRASRRISLVQSHAVFEELPYPADSVGVWDYVIPDDESQLGIGKVSSRYAAGLWRLAMVRDRVRLADVFMPGIAAENVAGYVPRAQGVHLAPGPGNLFADPEFIAGTQYWPHIGSMQVVTEASPHGGQMLHLSAIAAGGTREVSQLVGVPQGAEGAGAIYTLGALVRVVGPGYVYPRLPTATVKLYPFEVREADGWCLMPPSFIPQGSGLLPVGWRVRGHDPSATHVYIARPWLGPGNEAWVG